MVAVKRRRKIRKRRRWEGWQRSKVLYICIIASVLIHLAFIFSISPWWLGKVPRLRPRKVKAVSLRLKRLPAPPRPLVKAPPKPAVVKPPEKVPTPMPVFTKKELEQKLAQVRSDEVPKKFARPKAVRARDVIKRKVKEAQVWVDKEFDALEERIEREEVGEVGYSRIIDLKESSDYQVGRIMDHFDMNIEYGSRKITDLNIQFTTEWLFTPGQIRNYLSRYGRLNYRKIVDAIPAGTSVVALKESGEGPTRSYIAPTVDAMAAILVAEEDYFIKTGADPDEMERLVFGPIWTYKGPSFEVVEAEKIKLAEEQTPTEKKEEVDTK